ncbi:hypothetical protein [Pseudomonas aeruginosa]|uniref:hypothetical protein n=1 Tax=Pseudomonas aeruginosa TaxID=287 RepID=UPI0012986066|nr:hypothetical protein [Pseudomonas aeruginosa]
MPENMKLASIWVVWGFLSLAALGWGLQVVITATDIREGMAAWVQAIGSVGAIVAAIFVSIRQSRDQDSEKEKKKQVITAYVLEVSTQCAAVSSALAQSFSTDEARLEQTTTLASAEERLLALRGINPADFPDPEMVQLFMILRGAMERAVLMATLIAKAKDCDTLACKAALTHDSQAIRDVSMKLMEIGRD